MFGRSDTKVEIRIPKLSGSADPPRFSANLVAAAVVKADRLLSPEGEGSDVVRLNRAGEGSRVEADPVTVIAVKKALHWRNATRGAFEPALGPVKALWESAAAKPGVPPGEGEILSALELSRASHLAMDPDGCGLSWKREGCMLDLGGVSEGVAADLALEVLASRGVEHASVRLGGAVATMGVNTGAKPPARWDFGFRDPQGNAIAPPCPGGVREISGGWRAAAFCGYRQPPGPALGPRGFPGRGRLRDGEGDRDAESRCRGCCGCGRRFRLLDPASGRPLPAGRAAAAFHPGSAADASAAAVAMGVLGPAGAERFLSEKGREFFPEGLLALVFAQGPEGALDTTSLLLDADGGLQVSRNLSPSPESPSGSDRSGAIPLLPLAALSS
ncbi:MAG: FAD:protein FMN transferase [Deltaproteobacteria bacterium]|jgi:thiamine biosynthesis lipoprotein ApbE|nr:FAD:protein FMN transferase [Deltaproteobacteria bacterium]